MCVNDVYVSTAECLSLFVPANVFCSYVERCHADFLVLATTAPLLWKCPTQQASVGPSIILLLLIDSGLILPTLQVSCLFVFIPFTGHLRDGTFVAMR